MLLLLLLQGIDFKLKSDVMEGKGIAQCCFVYLQLLLLLLLLLNCAASLTLTHGDHDQNGRTALTEAVRNNHEETVELLLNGGANADDKFNVLSVCLIFLFFYFFYFFYFFFCLFLRPGCD